MSVSDIVKNFQAVRAEGFSFSCDFDEGKICMKLEGKVDIPNPDEVLLPVLLGLDREFVENRIAEVSFDIQSLEFINSSGIKVVLQLVMSILNRPESHRYRISFLHDPEKKYQKKSFNAMSFLAPNLISFVP